MKTPDPKTAALRASDLRELKEAAYRGRSAAYRYLRKNYEKLVREKVGTSEGPSWDDVAALMNRKGHQSVRGTSLTANAVRRVFRRVEQDIAQTRHAAKAARAGTPQRSRPNPDWQPRAVAPRATQPSAGQPDDDRRPSQDDWLPRPINSQGPKALPSMDRQPVSEEEAEARLAKLRRTFAERSGH